MDSPTAVARETSRLAILSFVFGIFSMVGSGAFASIPAIICGHLARKQIRTSRETLGGGGLALTALIIGYLTTILTILWVAFLFEWGGDRPRMEAKNSSIAALAALKGFKHEYDRFPLGSSRSEDATFGEDNSRIFNVLRFMPGTDVTETAQNSRKLIFLNSRR